MSVTHHVFVCFRPFFLFSELGENYGEDGEKNDADNTASRKNGVKGDVGELGLIHGGTILADELIVSLFPLMGKALAVLEGLYRRFSASAGLVV